MLLKTVIYLAHSSTDNGGGMDPERMRHCMSLGYSVKSKMADTIGQCEF